MNLPKLLRNSNTTREQATESQARSDMQANLTFAGYHTQLLWVDVPVEVHHDAGLDCTSQTARLQHNCSACRLPCCGTGIVPSHAGSEGPVRKLSHFPSAAAETTFPRWCPENIILDKAKVLQASFEDCAFVPFHVVLCFSIVVLLMHRPCLLSRRSFVLQSTWLKGCKIGYPAQI